MNIPKNAPPKLTEQLAAQFRAQAAEFGLVLAARCRFCGAPIWSEKSLARHAGPVCAARNKQNDPGAHSAKNARTEAA